MAVSQDRFDLALRQLGQSDWQRFERLASTFLVSEWPELRTMASTGGDGGRDSMLFSPVGKANVSIQYSVQQDWKAKIRSTVKRLKETFPDTQFLVYLTNQQIGAKADALRSEVSGQGIFLDVRDKSWFVERTNLDENKSVAASELARILVDPLLESNGVLARTGSALSGQEAKTALMFLEMQWRNEHSEKGLTKSSFEALVRGALQGTNSANTIPRADIYVAVGRFLPKHPHKQLAPYIDGALKRLSKSAVRHVVKDDSFNLSYEESERLKDVASAIAILNQSFEVDVRDIVDAASEVSDDKKTIIVELAHKIIESYFLRKGEEFAASLARDVDPPIDDHDLNSIIAQLSPAGRLVDDRSNAHLLLHVVTTLLTNPSDATKEYLRLLSDSYALFAFLEEVPDVQKVTKKLFNHGEIWLDTSVLLPVIAEQAFPEDFRPFTALFEQAKIAKTKLLVTSGVLEELERHLNLCVTFTRSTTWNGRVPYVYTRYSFAGRSGGGFLSWVEQFRGESQPVQDLADYLLEKFGIEAVSPIISNDIDPKVTAAIRNYWREVQDNRRPSAGGFSMNANRLAEHDSENCISVLSERRMQRGKSSLGFASWWLTLDGAARKMMSKLDEDVSREIGHSPVISVDFLLKYLAFGPSRDQVDRSAQQLPYIFAGPILEIPKELLDAAQKARSENGDLPERIIQRRIRDALDRERLKAGPVQIAGLDGAPAAINEMF